MADLKQFYIFNKDIVKFRKNTTHVLLIRKTNVLLLYKLSAMIHSKIIFVVDILYFFSDKRVFVVKSFPIFLNAALEFFGDYLAKLNQKL